MSLVRGVGAGSPAGPIATPHHPPETAPGFGDDLGALLRRAAPASTTSAPPASRGIQLSRQAADRLQESGHLLDPDDLADLGAAVGDLARRGATNSLVLLDDHAFLVRVPDRTITTVMTRRDAAQNVFPHIDSTAVAR